MLYSKCCLCPRRCGVDRTAGQSGFCRADAAVRCARAALHYWEEPCISAGSDPEVQEIKQGSGAVFFTGCNLGCVFCQNYGISHGIPGGVALGAADLADIFFSLKDQHAYNINLVTPDIHIPVLAEAIALAKERGIGLPFIWNSSAYVTVEALRILDGLVDVYLPDLKFISERKAARYLRAADYPQAARAAIAEMVRQAGRCVFDAEGMIQKGVIVRHLLMPGGLLEAKMIVKELHENYGDRIWLSLMNQYTPLTEHLQGYPELQRPVTEREYTELIEYALDLGITQAYMQEGGTAKESFIPAFDGTGVKRRDGDPE